MALWLAPVHAAELIVGTAMDDSAQPIRFRIESESRENLIGGELLFGGVRYAINRTSLRGLIGASRFEGIETGQSGGFAEFVVRVEGYRVISIPS